MRRSRSYLITILLFRLQRAHTTNELTNAGRRLQSRQTGRQDAFAIAIHSAIEPSPRFGAELQRLLLTRNDVGS